MNLFSVFTVFTILSNEHIKCSGSKLSDGVSTPDILINQLSNNVHNVPRPKEFEMPIEIPDPYEFEWAEFNLPGEVYTFNMNISKGSISGLSELQILDLNPSTSQPTIEFNILFPHLKFYSEHYELDGNILYAVPLRGEGEAHIEMFNLQAWGTLFVKNSPTNDGLLLDKFENAALKLERIVSKIDFDHNIDAIVSALVEEPLCDYLNRFNKFIIAKYGDILVQHINHLLQELEMNTH